jgi:hypothetical protein
VGVALRLSDWGSGRSTRRGGLEAVRAVLDLDLPQKEIVRCEKKIAVYYRIAGNGVFNADICIGRYNIIDIISYHYITFSRILIFFISIFKR